MSQITLTDVVFYKDGIPGQSEVVGMESGVSRVVRYSFLAPEVGGTGLTFRLNYLSHGGGYQIPVRFAISTDPDSHPNADGHTPHVGTVDRYTYQGSAQIRLIPGKTYYLWLFPGQNAWGWYYAPKTGTVTTTGVSQGVATVDGDAYIGQPISITIHSTPGYTHKLYWEFAGISALVGEDLGSSVIWTPIPALAIAIPNAQSGICALTCYSYRDGVQVGDPQTTHFTLSVSPECAPQVTANLVDTSKASEALGMYVEKVTQLEVEVTTTLSYAATVISTAITLDGEAYDGAALTAGAHTVAVTVTDSRGFTGHWEQAISVAAYDVPQLEINASRCRADGTLDDTGDHAKVTIRGTVSQLPGNTGTLTLSYGGTSQELPSGVGNFETIAIVPADPNETVRLRARITDAVKSVTRSMVLSTGYPTMEFLTGGKGIAFGMVPTDEGFQCAMDARFFGKITDSQGRPVAARYELTPVTGMYLTHHYGRILDVMGAGYLQLKFKCNRYLDPGDQLYTAELPLTENLTVKDAGGSHTLTLTPTGIVTPNALSTGTYTFSCLLY